MNTDTGRIIHVGFAEGLSEAYTNPFRTPFKEMKVPPTPKQERRKKVGRNDPCPCGSKKKFKRCCLNRKTFGL